MSSGRLFLDRVGRHQSPSLLRRHAQTITHFPRGTSKPELSTLLGRGTFYFALTLRRDALRNRSLEKLVIAEVYWKTPIPELARSLEVVCDGP